jgi:hypothetical protein
MKAATRAAQMEKATTDAEGGTADPTHPAQNEDHDPDKVVWELSENGLQEGSTLSGSKALVEDYPEDEANSKKTKKTNTGKGKESNSNTRKLRRAQERGRPLRGQPLQQP